MKQKNPNKHRAEKRIRLYKKPYLLRHACGLAIAAVLFVWGGVKTGSQMLFPAGISAVLSSSIDQETEEVTTGLITTPYGLSFTADKSLFELKAYYLDQSGEHEIDVRKINQSKQLSRISIEPIGDSWSPAERASRLDIEFGQEHKEQESFSDSSLTIVTEPMDTSLEKVGDIVVQKVQKKNTITTGEQNLISYSISWSGDLGEVPVSIELKGLISSKVPDSYQALLSGFNSRESRVLGIKSDAEPFRLAVAKTKAELHYLVDSVSPATVKIYNIVCGALIIDGQEVSEDICEASSGSGFFISSSGHIATNGHVITYDAEDALVNALLKNPHNIPGFLRYMGLSDAQIDAGTARPEILAAIIAKVYDAPPGSISFKNLNTALIVSLGPAQLVMRNEEDARKAINREDSESLKRAKLIGIDYSAKDLLVIESDSQAGFSSSDVAIIQVDLTDTPFIRLYEDKVTQNQNITIIGFPKDAENQLTDNNSISPTVTNGTISAIRLAAGSNYKLYQSDADASSGSSGGPVISEDGRVLGILTYRFKSSLGVDAAKSYVRDINDIRSLAIKHKVNLGAANGQTQTKWEEGLSYYSKARFSKALTAFNDVRRYYPPHRLAAQYQAASEDAIAKGRDEKDLPLTVGIAISLTGASTGAWTIILIAKHNKLHKGYKLSKRTRIFRPKNHHNDSGGRYASA